MAYLLQHTIIICQEKEMSDFPTPTNDSRLGMHYFPDTDHYRESDLNFWLPKLEELGISWLTLIAPVNRAIPEKFIRGLVSANIEPVLHFHLSIDSPPETRDLSLLLNTYKRWGVNYVTLFDRPNIQDNWSGISWAKTNLVERFLDIYLPLADLIINSGLYVVFPPLVPGGDYWDTAFLRAALSSIDNRGHSNLLSKLIIGAYAFTDNRPLNWGAGGPERWPGAKPYYTPEDEQDHRGFRIYDWYNAISQATINSTLPIMILAASSQTGSPTDLALSTVTKGDHNLRTLMMAKAMVRDFDEELNRDSLDPVPANVLACNFWLLSAKEGSPHEAEVWYKEDRTSTPIVDTMREWIEERLAVQAKEKKIALSEDIHPVNANKASDNHHPIEHYLLLPLYEWGVADWHLEVIRPYVKKHKPTIGFSMSEAARASQVTIVGGSKSFPEELVQELKMSGCRVKQISGDGTSIATQLSEA
jgi:hypothetical protein